MLSIIVTVVVIVAACYIILEIRRHYFFNEFMERHDQILKLEDRPDCLHKYINGGNIEAERECCSCKYYINCRNLGDNTPVSRGR